MKNDKTTPQIREFIDAVLNLRLGMKQFIQRKLREEDIDLTYEMLQVLTVLWRNGDLNQQDIANRIQKNKASLTSLIDNLQKRELVIRTEDSSDRRNKIISLTKLGIEYKEQFSPITASLYSALHQDVSKERLNEVVRLLNQMNGNLQ